MNATSRRIRPQGLLALAALFLVALALPAQPEKTPEELVKQLGHAKFSERADASQALEGLGAKALPALREAAKDANPEVAARAAELIQAIEKKGEIDAALQPTYVALKHERAPLRDVVADLAKQSGYVVKLDKAADGQKAITLNTGRVPFWQALDELCKKAELTLGPVEMKKAEREGENLRFQMGNMPKLPGNPNIVLRGMPLLEGGAPSFERAELKLVPGKPLNVPTAYVGALWVRALPIKQAENENIREHTALLIDVRPEPKLAWRAPLELRTGKLTDDKGQAVEVAGTELSNGKPEEDKKQQENMAFQLDGPANGPAFPFNQQLAVMLRTPDQPGKALPAVQAVLSGQLQGPSLPVISIPDVAKAGTKPHKNARGDELTVLAFKELDDGDVELQVELKAPQEAGAGGNVQMQFQQNMQVQIGGNFRMGKGGMKRLGGLMAGGVDVHLYDQNGKPYSMSTQSLQTNIAGGEKTSKMTLRCEAPKEGSKPAKLTYETNRPTTFETPVTLKNVPLPPR